jgi:hypothetical protein
MYLGSDALALAPLTDRVAHLEDRDWVVVTREGADIRDALGRPVKRLREARFAVAKDIKERDLFLASPRRASITSEYGPPTCFEHPPPVTHNRLWTGSNTWLSQIVGRDGPCASANRAAASAAAALSGRAFS